MGLRGLSRASRIRRSSAARRLVAGPRDAAPRLTSLPPDCCGHDAGMKRLEAGDADEKRIALQTGAGWCTPSGRRS